MSSVINIEIFLFKIKNDYYFNINSLLKDVIFLFKYISANFHKLIPDLKDKEKDKEFPTFKNYKIYLNELYFSFIDKLESIEKPFKKLLKEDLANILISNNLPKKSKQIKY